MAVILTPIPIPSNSPSAGSSFPWLPMVDPHQQPGWGNPCWDGKASLKEPLMGWRYKMRGLWTRVVRQFIKCQTPRCAVWGSGQKNQTKPGLLAEPENIYQGIRDRFEKLCCAGSDGLWGKERWKQGVERWTEERISIWRLAHSLLCHPKSPHWLTLSLITCESITFFFLSPHTGRQYFFQVNSP